MAGFKKAKAEQAALKMGIYGLAGSGKTLTTLLLMEGLCKLTGKRMAVVDTERGTDFYSQEVKERTVHPEAFDFDALYTRSITDVMKAVRSLKPADYCAVQIDSITHIWESAIAAYSGDLTKIGTIPLFAWQKIKRPYKELMNFLLSSPLHVFIVGRQGNDFDKDEESGELTKVGVKMKAEGETPYEPHILIRMESEKRKGDTSVITAFAEKDRSGILAGRTIEFPNFDKLVRPLLPLLGEKQASVEDVDETAARDAEHLSERDETKAKSGDLILRKFTARIVLCDTYEALCAIGKEITPEIKKGMSTQQVSELRAKYQEAEQVLKPA